MIGETVIEELKSKHGQSNLRRAVLQLNDEGTETLEVIVKVPNRKVLGEFEKFVEKQPDRAKEILVTNCVLTDLDKIKEDDALFFQAVDAVCELFPTRRVVVMTL